MSIERTDDDGRWESDDGGRTWALVEPSQAWLDAVNAIPDPPDPGPSVEEQLAEVTAALNALAGGGD